jgi:hypothetical protein
VVIVGLLVSFLIFKNRYIQLDYSTSVTVPTSTNDIMKNEEKEKLGLSHFVDFEVVSRDASGTPTNYRSIGTVKASPLVVEFMSPIDKVALGINTNLKIQVIARDSQGKIIRYKVIKKDSDIVTEY